MPIRPEEWTLEKELLWLKAHVQNIARRHGHSPQEICDYLIDEVCA